MLGLDTLLVMLGVYTLLCHVTFGHTALSCYVWTHCFVMLSLDTLLVLLSLDTLLVLLGLDTLLCHVKFGHTACHVRFGHTALSC